MGKICFPFHRSQGWYESLRRALQSMANPKRGGEEICDYHLFYAVTQNVCYRDFLRENGVEALLERLHEELHGLPIEERMWESLKECLEDEHIAPYDIQCYPKNEQVTILGHKFRRLRDIEQHVSISSSERQLEKEGCIHDCRPYPDVFIGELWLGYPILDYYDLGDDRRYQNYIFRAHPITTKDLEEAMTIPHDFNFCMVHEDIPPTLLPILYFDGDSNFMTLATAKESSSYGSDIKELMKVAEHEHAKAQYFLALCYSAGEGVERDAQMALKWLAKAAKNGDPEAKEVIPDVEKQVSGESIIGNKMKVMLLKSLLLTDINR